MIDNEVSSFLDICVSFLETLFVGSISIGLIAIVTGSCGWSLVASLPTTVFKQEATYHQRNSTWCASNERVMTTDQPIREPDQIRHYCARKLRVVKTSDHFQTDLGCLLDEDWTAPPIVEMFVSSEGRLLGRCERESELKVLLGNVGYLVAKVAEVKSRR